MRSFIKVVGVSAALALGLPSWAADSGGGGAALLTPKWGIIFWTAVTFLVLAWILGKFA